MSGRRVWIVFDHERYDTRDSESPLIAAVFTDRHGALETRKLLEARPHPGASLGYSYRFEIAEFRVHDGPLTADDVARGAGFDEVSPPPRAPGA